MFGLRGKINKAMDLYESGEYEKSLKLCQDILKSDSSNASIWVTAGNVYYVNKKFEEAIKYYREAIKHAPDNFSAWINWANSCIELKKYQEAIQCAAQGIKINPDSKLPYTIMGNAYNELEKYPESITCLKEALKRDKNDPWLHNYLSQSYQKNGNYIDSLSSAWKAIELGEDGDNSHQINISYLFYEIAMEKGLDSILECVELWVKKYGTNPIVKYTANALMRNAQIKRADISYVRNIFDIFASDFEQVLSSLNYCAPSLISEEMKQIYSSKKSPKLRILDLGCGTGLCGEFLKNYAIEKGLDGLDISSKMLEEAAKKNIYSNLVNAEIISYLKACETTYDLMVASDVFTYFGDLNELFEYINKTLSENGRILFTISENNYDKKSYCLHPSGRFLHSENYVREILKKHGFDVEKMERKKLRNEGGKAVMGYIISASKKI